MPSRPTMQFLVKIKSHLQAHLRVHQLNAEFEELYFGRTFETNEPSSKGKRPKEMMWVKNSCHLLVAT